jgi:hypothetical protein
MSRALCERNDSFCMSHYYPLRPTNVLPVYKHRILSMISDNIGPFFETSWGCDLSGNFG